MLVFATAAGVPELVAGAGAAGPVDRRGHRRDRRRAARPQPDQGHGRQRGRRHGRHGDRRAAVRAAGAVPARARAPGLPGPARGLRGPGDRRRRDDRVGRSAGPGRSGSLRISLAVPAAARGLDGRRRARPWSRSGRSPASTARSARRWSSCWPARARSCWPVWPCSPSPAARSADGLGARGGGAAPGDAARHGGAGGRRRHHLAGDQRRRPPRCSSPARSSPASASAPGFQGALRIVVPLAAADERAGVLSTLYVVSYLAMGLPAVVGGVLVVHGGGLLATGREYGAAVIVLALLAMAALAWQRPERAGRAQAAVVPAGCGRRSRSADAGSRRSSTSVDHRPGRRPGPAAAAGCRRR